MHSIRGVLIENIYWMLSYAWDEFEAARDVSASLDRTGAPLAPFAACFLSGIERLVGQGFYQSFVRQRAILSTLRGRILLAPTIRLGADRLGRAWCEYERVSADVLPNQIIRTALRKIDQSEELGHEIRARARALDRRFHNVRILASPPRDFSIVGVGAQKRGYRFLLALARFILTDLRPVGPRGQAHFIDVDVDRVIHDVFERFVRNFLRRNLEEFDVRRTRRKWADAYAINEEARGLLPSLETDVVLRNTLRTIVIDTKFYSRTLREHRGVERAREGHLYQMLGYLHNMKRSGEFKGIIEGLLLYPAAQASIDAQWRIHGFPVRLCTLDLSGSWQRVSEDLLDIARKGGAGSYGGSAA